MKRQTLDRMVAFRTSEAQVAMIEKIAVETGLPSSTVIRQMIDSALMIGRPIIVSGYAQPPVVDHRMAVTHGT